MMHKDYDSTVEALNICQPTENTAVEQRPNESHLSALRQFHTSARKSNMEIRIISVKIPCEIRQWTLPWPTTHESRLHETEDSAANSIIDAVVHTSAFILPSRSFAYETDTTLPSKAAESTRNDGCRS